MEKKCCGNPPIYVEAQKTFTKLTLKLTSATKFKGYFFDQKKWLNSKERKRERQKKKHSIDKYNSFPKACNSTST